ncbi:hypothetical protein ASPWEDRAFT_171544 [Aspergillus wentii DTO 134E9]|uniref:FAD-binding PCMH-type domain-containing protein n=1 Tax=Aspergillus wentii DTO 134E9 TaxID=1073089 RepID=A0A1L9RIF1_ASPWE|nr:uncharacterized protein ASPWEDRAFT_171544 [Aspergillus wentii DTO 134E9]KAI9932329.1 hypothetical protein MW887_009841 [Aspergillus wentii]OJJ34706.1 hypothetical protein ASPWEDRAFT_171544 [Aspergillus wentii DTO 134E9]
MHITWRDSPENAIYESARIDNAFNFRRPTRLPLAIVKATSADDVIAATRLAQQHRCRITVRSGGHSFGVLSVQDDVILVDLHDWKEIDVDVHRGLVAVTPGVESKALYDRLIVDGLTFPVGHCPSVGMGGFLLQGGMGWNTETLGWACEYIEGADVVTAQGELVHCSKDYNPDLFWAVRGAGPAFPGLVVRFQLKTTPHPKAIHTSGYVYPREKYREAFDWIRSLQPNIDSDTTSTAVVQYHGKKICFGIYITSWKNTPEEAKTVLQSIHQTRPTGTVAEWCCRPEKSLEKSFRIQDKGMPKGLRYCTENAYLKNDTDVSAVLEEAFLTLPHRKSIAFWTSMRKVSRRDEMADMALSVHSDDYFALYAMWEDEKDDQRCEGWLRSVMMPIEPHTAGTYMGETVGLRRGRYWSEENTERLMEIRRKWDPYGLIHGGFTENAGRKTANL